jgi:hypothetical protein
MSVFTTSEQLGQLAKALAAAQFEMGAAVKGSVNPHFKSRYADFAAVVDASRPVLAKQGLALIQGTASEGATVTVATRLLHTSGEWIESALTLTARDASPQALASVLTYGRRYGWSTLIGLAADEDDDGEKASPRPAQPVQEASSVPAGFAEWLMDLEAIADEGTERLKQTWSQSPLAFRSHLSNTQRGLVDQLKVRAAAKDSLASVLISELPAAKAGKK